MDIHSVPVIVHHEGQAYHFTAGPLTSAWELRSQVSEELNCTVSLSHESGFTLEHDFQLEFFVSSSILQSGSNDVLDIKPVVFYTAPYIVSKHTETVTSTCVGEPNTRTALECIFKDVNAKLMMQPSFMYIAIRPHHKAEDVHTVLKEIAPDMKYLASTTHSLLASSDGVDSDPYGVSAFSVRDISGKFGVGLAEANSDKELRFAAMRASVEAKALAGHPNTDPDCVIVVSNPGDEETVLEGVKDVFGRKTFIIGGTSADDVLDGSWWVTGGPSDGFLSGANVIGVIALWPTYPCVKIFDYGYCPSIVDGIVTKMDGPRHVVEINNRPAAEVYNEMVCMAFTDVIEKARTTGEAVAFGLDPACTLGPIGKVVHQNSQMPSFIIVHPHTITPVGGFTTFANLEEGEKITLMPGTYDMLVKRVSYLTTILSDLPNTSGGIFWFCAGVKSVLQEAGIKEVVQRLKRHFLQTPFLLHFTFGENGSFHDNNTMQKSGLYTQPSTDNMYTALNRQIASMSTQHSIGSAHTNTTVAVGSDSAGFHIAHACLSFAMLSFGSPITSLSLERVAFLVTDVKSSTYLWDTYGPVMERAISIHNHLFKNAMNHSVFGAYEVLTAGDSFTIAFPSANNAVQFAVFIQVMLLMADWPEEILEDPQCCPCESDGTTIWRGLKIRMGIHVGKPQITWNKIDGRLKYYGSCLNRATHISDIADGGQIFISEAVFDDLDMDEFANVGGIVHYNLGLRALENEAQLCSVFCVVPKLLHQRLYVVGQSDEYTTNLEEVDNISSSETHSTASFSNRSAVSFSSNSKSLFKTSKNFRKVNTEYLGSNFKIVKDYDSFVAKQNHDIQYTSPQASMVNMNPHIREGTQDSPDLDSIVVKRRTHSFNLEESPKGTRSYEFN
ncbi:hypothetical protein PCE1_001912 [Barthelona sp. PCE]